MNRSIKELRKTLHIEGATLGETVTLLTRIDHLEELLEHAESVTKGAEHIDLGTERGIFLETGDAKVMVSQLSGRTQIAVWEKSDDGNMLASVLLPDRES